MISKASCYIVKFSGLLRQSMFAILIAYIVASPVVTIMVQDFELKYELREIYGEDNPKEKEMVITEIESREKEIYSTQNISSFYCNNLLAAFNPDIRLPPPKRT